MKYLASRRKFMSSLIVAPAILSIPKTTLSKNNRSILYISRLHPVRFIAGLIFDFFESIFVDFVTDAIVSSFLNGSKKSNIKLGRSSGFELGREFQHPNYKVSNVILGVSDYEAHKKRKLKLLLSNEYQLNRFENLIYYLRSEGIRIKTSETEYSFPIGNDMEPDDIFMIDYFQMDKFKNNHYENLIKITDVNVFNNWSS